METRWGLLTPLYGMTTSRKAWYEAMGDYMVDELCGGWGATLLGKSVSHGEKKSLNMVFEKV